MPEKTWPVAEVFGPTIQGEGEWSGVPCYFVRFGGCDFKCEWCDTPHAVLAHSVRRLPRMTADDVMTHLEALHAGPQWVILSGGNPALHELGPVVDALVYAGYKVAVETQGTKFKHWLNRVDSICVSPKPPSSQMWPKVMPALNEFMGQCTPDFFKVVVFDQTDYKFASGLHQKWPRVPMFLSAGNDAGRTVGNPSREDDRDLARVQQDLIDKYRWLVNYVLLDPVMHDVRVQAQQHVLLWGNEQGR